MTGASLFTPDFKAHALLVGADAAGRSLRRRRCRRASTRRRRLRLYGSERGAADGARRPLDAGGRRGGGRLGLQHAERRAGQLQRQAELCGAGRKAWRRAGARASSRKGIARSPGSANSSRAERIDCDYRVCGPLPRRAQRAAIRGAGATRRQSAAGDRSRRAIWCRAPSRRSEIGTDAYHGGVVYTPSRRARPGALPSRLAGARHRRRRDASSPHCAATAIERQGGGFRVRHVARRRSRRATSSSAPTAIRAALTPWLRRRVIPIGSYIIATEPIAARDDGPHPAERPHGHRHAQGVYYYRASPDRTRILFGGRVSWNETDPRVSAPLLQGGDGAALPGARRTCGSAIPGWASSAFTFDTLMHTGTHDGIHYATGYCGSGVGMASYLGMKLGLKVLGRRGRRDGVRRARLPTPAVLLRLAVVPRRGDRLLPLAGRPQLTAPGIRRSANSRPRHAKRAAIPAGMEGRSCSGRTARKAPSTRTA